MKQRRGIVKSGNAGNSSKPSPPSPPSVGISTQPHDAQKPLFPPGSKYPLSLLSERCQKLSWDRPTVDTPYDPKKGYRFVVTLSRVNSKQEEETVRLAPHPPYFKATAVEARHWGATYALYRFCNNMQLQFQLPAGPREYWKELAEEHKQIPQHQRWMYDADPFTAQSQSEGAQAAKHQSATVGSKSSEAHLSNEFSHCFEIRMESSIRDLVEEAVKKAVELYPEAPDATPLVLSEDESLIVAKQLRQLGFTPSQIRRAMDFFSKPSSFVSRLLTSMSSFEASIEYLVLHIPECDLPSRFLPVNNSSNPLITSSHSGTGGDLRMRWMKDKAIKEAGWPSHAVEECIVDPKCTGSWDVLLVTLGRKLIGEQYRTTGTNYAPYKIDPDEWGALGASLEDKDHLIMPMFSAPIDLHILLSSNKAQAYPRRDYAPIYISSLSVPAYIRLHLLACLLKHMQSDDFVEPSEGFFLVSMRVLEDEWAKIESNGPPDIASVLAHLLPSKRMPDESVASTDAILNVDLAKRSNRAGYLSRHNRRLQTDEEIQQDFAILCQNEKYQSLLATRQKLPAFNAKDRFLKELEKSRVVVVVGGTGCGKTTQLPQFILDSLIQSSRGSEASILVTQPRRISAISVSSRVSSERLDDGSVGYAIRGESKRGPKTKILFCTTGVVLRRLASGDALSEVSHIVVDEVHERSVDVDLLLLEMKRLLRRNPLLKVVLMSATINHQTFVDYFDQAPLLNIPGFTHPVTDRYLEDIIEMTGYSPRAARSSKGGKDKVSRKATDNPTLDGFTEATRQVVKALAQSDQIDYELIATLVKHIISNQTTHGGILIFLPGISEIRQCIHVIKTTLQRGQAHVLPLHATMSSDEQRRVFEKVSEWIIVVATNIAETSITIDDITFVIDSGKVKETHYNPETCLTQLIETWVTRAAAKQRRGRAGRTQPGTCFKLYTRAREADLQQFPVPEILRIPLENIILTVKVMREDEDVKGFLQQAISPPKAEAMDSAWATLRQLGAIDNAGELTALGRHMSLLPVDLRLAKMLILGTVFKCLQPTLTIASCLSSKPLFLSPLDMREEATKAKARFNTDDSDLLTDLNAYDAYTALRQSSSSDLEQFCKQNLISCSAVREITMLRNEYLSSLAETGLIPRDMKISNLSYNLNSKNINLIKAVILGGMWPRLAKVHLPRSAIKFDKVRAGTIQRQNAAQDYKLFDINSGRVFLHPGSVLFRNISWKPPFVVYFHRYQSTKVFLRDGTVVPSYAILLFGGPVTVNHVAQGITVGDKEAFLKLKAWPRIGVLVNNLRRLLDAQLTCCVEEGTVLDMGQDNPVIQAMLALLTYDGMSG